MSLIDRCYHWEMCDCFTLSTRITLNITPFHYRGFEQHCRALKHVTRYTSTPHRTLEWQTHADTMTLCWKHVRNKISCVKFFKAILQIKRCWTKFWKDLLESDKLFTYWNMLCSQTSAFLSFLMRDWKCGEGGETDMTASNMSDGVLYKLLSANVRQNVVISHAWTLFFFCFWLFLSHWFEVGGTLLE